MWSDCIAQDGHSQASKIAGRRKITCFTKEHLELLRMAFSVDQYPGISVRESLSQATGLPESQIQVWFQNKRARTMKNKAIWVSHELDTATPLASPFLPPHMSSMGLNGQQRSIPEASFNIVQPQMPQFPPRDYSTPVIKPRQSRLMGTSSCSSSLPSDLQKLADRWSLGESTQSSPESTWSPPEQGFGNSYKDESNTSYPPPPYPHRSAKVEYATGLESLPTSPASSDSAFWDMGLENCSPSVPYFDCCSPLDRLVEEQPVGPLPFLSTQCVDDVLGKMEPACWILNGQKDLQSFLNMPHLGFFTTTETVLHCFIIEFVI
ncbi:LOW QUALITY PROTEIN: mix-type homeobox gene 2 [Xyrauchen texanus]|uniref:LOW QUALITY PROTEIN: mix-type homeobox gene 2 n=1 Tax=Xyrauchen texanus TaxID=154827 RepID=UPI0022429CA2|nr:LOW QUALITY PROTEIN: mix-type homeobox gene 2 [Xyrauchen texanus]